MTQITQQMAHDLGLEVVQHAVINHDHPDVEVAIAAYERKYPDAADRGDADGVQLEEFLDHLREIPDDDWPHEHLRMHIQNGFPVKTTMFGEPVLITPVNKEENNG